MPEMQTVTYCTSPTISAETAKLRQSVARIKESSSPKDRLDAVLGDMLNPLPIEIDVKIRDVLLDVLRRATTSSDDQFLFSGDYLKKRDINPVELMVAFSVVGFWIVAKTGDDVRVCL